MHHHYPTTNVVLTVALGLLGVNLLTRPNAARPMKPAAPRNAAPTAISLNPSRVLPLATSDLKSEVS